MGDRETKRSKVLDETAGNGGAQRGEAKAKANRSKAGERKCGNMRAMRDGGNEKDATN